MNDEKNEKEGGEDLISGEGAERKCKPTSTQKASEEATVHIVQALLAQ
jgi:hypothetical protein